MSRRVNSGKLPQNAIVAAAGGNGPPGAPPPADDFLGRLVKYIPTEIIALYVAVTGLVPKSDAHPALMLIFIACLVLTPIYLWFGTRDPAKAVPYVQIVLATIGFAVWSFALGGPFEHIRPDYVASIVLIFTTFIFGMIKPNAGS